MYLTTDPVFCADDYVLFGTMSGYCTLNPCGCISWWFLLYFLKFIKKYKNTNCRKAWKEWTQIQEDHLWKDIKCLCCMTNLVGNIIGW
jgi:hypothetical protein